MLNRRVAAIIKVYDRFRLLQSGAQIYIVSESRYLGNDERKAMLYLLRNMLECDDRNKKYRRAAGIEEAKRNGRYTGRKPI